MKTSDRVEVLHVISGLGVGGAERLLLWAARYHDRERYPLGIVSLMSGCELAPRIRDTGVPLVELGQRRGRLTPAGFKRLLRELRRFKPKILQGHMFHSNLLTRFARPLAGLKSLVVNTVHNEWQPWYRQIPDTATARFADGYITFSPRGEDVVTEPGPAGRPVCHIPYGIEIPARFEGDRTALRTRLALPTDRYVWIAVGSLTKQKAFGDLVEAFSTVVKRDKNPLLLIAGEGEDRPRLEGMVRDKGLTEEVRLLGLRQDVPDLMAASDAFVLSSHWEGGPLVVLEAMAASLPVVATMVGTVATMTGNGKTAILVEPRRPERLAQAMSDLMEMGDGARLMGKAGRARLEQYYDFCRMQRDVENFYDVLTGAAR
ncbi:MAG: glycosyltransferase [bacterium]|nr:MAG: glycosyltransferase [bacterium]